jgi:hypothetical protein
MDRARSSVRHEDGNPFELNKGIDNMKSNVLDTSFTISYQMTNKGQGEGYSAAAVRARLPNDLEKIKALLITKPETR